MCQRCIVVSVDRVDPDLRQGEQDAQDRGAPLLGCPHQPRHPVLEVEISALPERITEQNLDATRKNRKHYIAQAALLIKVKIILGPPGHKNNWHKNVAILLEGTKTCKKKQPFF